jgi:hypothetical protein
MGQIITALGIIGNVIIVHLMLYRGWTGRLPWFAITSALAVLVDCLCYFIHGFEHSLYAPVRVFVIYWMFPLLFCRCAWEAWRVGVKWLEYLMLIQVGIAAVALFAHLHGDQHTVYEVEWFAIYVDLAGILLCIWKFRKEANYERP